MITWYIHGFLIAEGPGAGVIELWEMYFEPMGKQISIFVREIYTIDGCALFKGKGSYMGQNIAILTGNQVQLDELRLN